MEKIIHNNRWYWGESYYIILDGGKGLCTMSITDDEPLMGYVTGLSVVNGYRNKGIGNRLLDACEELATKLGLDEICLSAEKNSFAYEWYLRHGFKKNKYSHKYLYKLSKKL